MHQNMNWCLLGCLQHLGAYNIEGAPGLGELGYSSDSIKRTKNLVAGGVGIQVKRHIDLTAVYDQPHACRTRGRACGEVVTRDGLDELYG